MKDYDEEVFKFLAEILKRLNQPRALNTLKFRWKEAVKKQDRIEQGF